MTSPAAEVLPLTMRTLGHYRIVEKIGAGGMGEVYRARDEHLDRDVAIKVLPPGTLTDESARKQFHKEALLLSKLDHPNVATTHDFDTQQGVDFLVMEYIPGITLSEKLSGRPLPEKEVIGLGTQLAEGLSAVHAHGVVHRDLKPGNLRLTSDGRLKILDFGLAKLRLPVTASALTESLSETRAMAGTLPYMAPEQLLGGEVNARTDIWGAGCVLFEMATGRQPFPGFGPALTEAILHAVTPLPSSLNPHVSAGLTAPILKCLEKDPENRYQSAKELAIDLRRLQTGVVSAPQPRAAKPGKWSSVKTLGLGLGILASAIAVLLAFNVGGWRERLLGRTGVPRIESLAVLPLANLSGDPQQEYFADGMTEALIADLSTISALRVISRTSVMQYKTAKKPLPEIAHELNVNGIIEGSVMRSGNRVRITVQLVAARPEAHIWANSYDRELQDVLALQSDVARTVAAQVKAKLTASEQSQLTKIRSVSPASHEAYLKGRYYQDKRTPEDLRKALAYFQTAIEEQPDYAPAHAGLAECYTIASGSYLGLSPLEAYPKAKQSAIKAIELDEALADGHVILAVVLSEFEWNWEGAEKEYQRAIELNPNSELAHRAYSELLWSLGRHEEALAQARTARELAPLSLIDNILTGTALYYAGRYEDAIVDLTQALELDPRYQRAHFVRGMAYAQERMFPQAIADFEQVKALTGESTESIAALGYGYAVAGRNSDARQAIRTLKQRQAKNEYVSPVGLAMIYAALGEKDPAFQWLEKALEQRATRTQQLRVDPAFASLRPDPRFHDLVRRMNFPP